MIGLRHEGLSFSKPLRAKVIDGQLLFGISAFPLHFSDIPSSDLIHEQFSVKHKPRIEREREQLFG